jgi:stalled ribosome rescue protein Dom34
MKKVIGLWIDHREAVIVSLTEKGDETKRLESDMEKHVRFSGSAEADMAEDMRDRRFTNHLNKYYDEVIASIREADSILILGPGEAKVELKQRLEAEQLGERIVGVETVDKLTDRQITARIRLEFSATKFDKPDNHKMAQPKQQKQRM